MVSPAPALLSRSYALPNGGCLVAPNENLRRLAARCSHFQITRSGFGGLNQSPKVLNVPSEGLSPVAGGIVALGKFDALHIGHRELAIQASKIGSPFLLSFVGMAEVLGWEPRAPIVAKCDRKRVLSSWAPYCGNIAPAEFHIDFSSVRHLTPQEFVEKLSKDLGVRGVVAGENYRFGYKASGDASELVRLCKEYNMGAYIINSVMDRNHYSQNTNSSDLKDRGQVSSTRVRRALAVGDMKYVSELLGRPHRLILMAKSQEPFTFSRNKVSASKLSLLNLAPKEGLYKNCSVFVGDEKIESCRVVIDAAYIHIEMDDVGSCSSSGTRDFQLLSIEFGNLHS
ncbi:FAD synthetase 1, chloroplastic isoform X2 [Ziziphus jujuba]|uniref:FAD synthase n=1 Tax=Ziziphus jujuba TaxID=326968 RepID=A0A6P4AW91_ZIZJJ|nr:FAD synthetase 1, chloroplastic isoform X2 [Ziziphus jujuba]